MIPSMSERFDVVIEKDEDGLYVGRVPELPGCVSQGKTVEELLEHIKEAIALYLEVDDPPIRSRFIGVKQVEVV